MYTIWYESSLRGRFSEYRNYKASIETLDDFKEWFYGFYDNVFSFHEYSKTPPFSIHIKENSNVGIWVRAEPYLGNHDYKVHMIKNDDSGKIVFTDGEYTNETCYINDKFREIVEQIADELSHPKFEFE